MTEIEIPKILLEHKAPDHLWGEPEGELRTVADIVEDIVGNYEDDAHAGGMILQDLHNPLSCADAVLYQLDFITQQHSFPIPVIQAVRYYGMEWSHEMFADYRQQSIYLSEVGEDTEMLYQIMEELVNECLEAYVNNEWSWGEDGDMEHYDLGRDAYNLAIKEIQLRCFKFEVTDDPIIFSK